ncbi:ABC transporter ATP-binding protein [Mesoplasma photuris]|uniref:ABC transporter ATP-binding protein n=1 Tax=Mesoplasma photuris TaxID=217731 RepID=UPI000A03E3D2|nr:ABC transporter ATP-binding protein [Mesoplasma photuris]
MKLKKEKQVKLRDLHLQRESTKLESSLEKQSITQEQFDEKYKDLIDQQIELNKNKGAFFVTIARYYRKEWHLGLLLVGLTALSAVISIMLPLLTQQMTKSIMIGNMLNGDLSKESLNAMIAVLEQNIINHPELAQMFQGQIISLENMVDGFWWLAWWESLIIAVAVIFGNMGIMFCTQYVGVVMGKRIEIDLRNKSLEALIRQDISYYSDKKIGEIITKVVSDTQIVGDQAATVPSTVISAFLTISASLTMMFVFEAIIASVIMATFVTILLIMAIAFGFTKKRITKMREVITDINGNVIDRVNNVRLIKSTGTENYETERFREVHKDYYKEVKKMAKVQSIMVVVLFGGISLMQMITVAMSMVLYNGGEESSSFFSTTFASFQMAQGTMTGSLFQMIMLTMGIAQASVAAVRVEKVVTEESIIDPHYFGDKKIKTIKGDIRFEGVRFAYPEKPNKTILPTFDFTFEEGKSYAFVGETGSGKSTIARLLLRFYDPTEGRIIINGNEDLRDINLSSYLYNVGYVEQEPQILYGNVYDNVSYGRFESSKRKVIEACKKAELHDLIMTWPDGYDTILGERGFMLSGGQKQRLIIARMFLKDPQLLILDEATSALDNIVEGEIQAKLDELMEGRTTISIAHRLSTIKNVDQIIVLGGNGGGIVQTGSFNELKTKPGHFKRLYEAGLMD